MKGRPTETDRGRVRPARSLVASVIAAPLMLILGATFGTISCPRRPACCRADLLRQPGGRPD